MNRTTRPPESLSIGQIFTSTYRIPLFQREYSWQESEINTLLTDIRTARQEGQDAYYLGTLVTDIPNGSDTAFGVIDGQQRLTTLFILLALAKKKFDIASPVLTDRLTFSGRPDETDFLTLLDSNLGDEIFTTTSEDNDGKPVAMQAAATIMRKALRDDDAGAGHQSDPSDDVIFTREDIEYTLDCVKLLRSVLPEGTNLHHYFEVMNTRGEQLEKHEILKARLMGELNREHHHQFGEIWDACSRLDQPIQLQFKEEIRNKLFGQKLDTFHPLTWGGRTSDSEGESKTLSEILQQSPTDPADAGDDSSDHQRSAIVDFPHFLLHALKLFTQEKVVLNDLRLLDMFNRFGPSDQDQIKKFSEYLLKCRYLFDTYVISTDGLTGARDTAWQLKKVVSNLKGAPYTVNTFSGTEDTEVEDRAKAVIHLQSMFQVTYTAQSQKSFITEILRWLLDRTQGRPRADQVTSQDFRNELEHMLRQRLTEFTFRSEDGGPSDVDNGLHVRNIIFNGLDYLLWKCTTSLACQKHLPQVPDPHEKRARNYAFRYRSSVEHFAPQHPARKKSDDELAEYTAKIHRFGNLCLMTPSENSRRSNFEPAAKAAAFKDDPKQTLKLHLMMDLVETGSEYLDRAEGHRKKMIDILQSFTEDRCRMENCLQR